MGAVSALTYEWMLSLVGRYISFLAAIIVAMPVFYGFCRAFKLSEFDQIIKAVSGKIRK